jgi:phage-related holin
VRAGWRFGQMSIRERFIGITHRVTDLFMMRLHEVVDLIETIQGTDSILFIRSVGSNRELSDA